MCFQIVVLRLQHFVNLNYTVQKCEYDNTFETLNTFSHLFLSQ